MAVLVVGCVADAGQAPLFEEPAPTQQDRRAQEHAASVVVLEFDLPDEFFGRPLEGPDAVIGFRVGVFRTSDLTEMGTMDVSRESVDVRDGTGRVTVDMARIPQDGDPLSLRARTLTRSSASAWSDPIPVEGPTVVQPVRSEPTASAPSPAARERARTPAVSRQEGLEVSEVERYQKLWEALHGVLDAGADVARELRRFRRINDLALAVVISRDLGVPFADLSSAIEGPPRLSVRRAVESLKPGLDSRALRDVRRNAAALSEPPSGSPR